MFSSDGRLRRLGRTLPVPMVISWVAMVAAQLLALDQNVSVRVAILQRMSDTRVPQASCEQTWAQGRCWLDAGWQATVSTVMASGTREGALSRSL